MELPQTNFSHRVVDIPVAVPFDKVDWPVVVPDQVSMVQTAQNTEVLHVQFLARVDDVQVVMHKSVRVIQKVRKTVEVPQVHHIDRIIGVPVVWQRQVPTVHILQKTAVQRTVEIESQLLSPDTDTGEVQFAR